MKQTAIAFLMVVFLAAQAAAEEGTVLKEQIEKDSYATGVALVKHLKQQGGSFDLDLVIKGMKDELTGEKLLLTEEGLRYKVIVKEDVPLTPVSSPQAPVRVRTPDRDDQDQSLRALAAASLASPKGNDQKTPASAPSSFQTSAQLEAPFQEHTFTAIAEQQQQHENDEGTIQIVLSDLSRRHADAWLKTLPHEQ